VDLLEPADEAGGAPGRYDKAGTNRKIASQGEKVRLMVVTYRRPVRSCQPHAQRYAHLQPDARTAVLGS
jgi:hypothetical protein